MSEALVVGVVRQAIETAVIVCLPMLLAGLVAGVLGVVALVLLVAGVVRLYDVYVPGELWIGYVALGGIFVVAGLLFWRQRNVKTAKV